MRIGKGVTPFRLCARRNRPLHWRSELAGTLCRMSQQRESFRAGLVQMCTGRDVARNVADASALIREAAGKGAQLRADARDHHADGDGARAPVRRRAPRGGQPGHRPLRRPRPGARHLAAYRLHGRPARQRQDRQPLAAVLARGGRAGALRQAAHVRRGAAGRRELPRIQELPGRQRRRAGRAALGHPGPDGLLRSALSRISIGRSPRPGPISWPSRRPSRARPARRTGTC